MGEKNVTGCISKTGTFGAVDELLHEMQGLTTQATEGVFTTYQMAEETGRSQKWCREKLKVLIGAGRVESAGKTPAIAIDGRQTFVPAYRVVK